MKATATDWTWEKSRRCEKQEIEEPKAFHSYYYYRVKAVPQYVFYLDQYNGTGWHIQDADLNDIITKDTKAECVWWVLAHK